MFRAAQDSSKRPEISMAHDLPKSLFHEKECSGDPTLDHIAVAPAAHIPGFLANACLGTLNYVGGGQAAVQAGRHVSAIDREGLLQSLA